jgi:hypothetical protein
MIINIDYGEDYDVLYILDENADPNELHHQFLEWLYDKNTEHTHRNCNKGDKHGRSK